MAFKSIVVETDDHVTTIKLNRPDALNALNGALLGCAISSSGFGPLNP